jgi:uncharacterized protein YciI
MARWVCIFDDASAMLAVRAERRASHHNYLSQNAEKILRAGALCQDGGGPPTGSLWLLNVASREEAVRLIELDPYFEPQHRSYRLFEWKWALSYSVELYDHA